MALSRRCDDARAEDPRPEPITAVLAGGNPDVGEHEDVEQLGAWSGPEGIEALSESAV